jgi:ribosome biogenesis GTPase
VEAFVAAVDRGRYRCWIGDREVTAMKARELGRGNIVTGDTVSLAGDTSGQPDTLARVVRVAPRTSVLRRSADDTDPVERVIVANADQLVIVCALADPPPRPRLIDRFLVAAYDAGLTPLLWLTKSDLADPGEILAAYQPLGLRYQVAGRPLDDETLSRLHDELAGRVSVLVGHSGVGKSTLFNALIPEASRATGSVNVVTGRGRHTSSSALALRLPDGGWVIDTPGLRSFGLAHISPVNVARAFPDLADAAAQCPPGCDHLQAGYDQQAAQGQPGSGRLQAGCGLDDWVTNHGGPANAARLDSLRRLLRSREGLDPAEATGAAEPGQDAP